MQTQFEEKPQTPLSNILPPVEPYCLSSRDARALRTSVSLFPNYNGCGRSKETLEDLDEQINVY